MEFLSRNIDRKSALMLKDLDSIFMVGILAKDVPVASGVWYRSGLKRARKDPTDKGTFDVCYVKLNVLYTIHRCWADGDV